MKQAIVRLALAFVFATGMATAIVWACGPDFAPLPTVTGLDPADGSAFNNGDVGVVRPRFRRANLVVAYRAFAGRPPLTIEEPTWAPAEDWFTRRNSLLGRAPLETPGRARRIIDYVTPINCLADAYVTAARTFDDRATRFGEQSTELRDWVVAQDTVFANCEFTPLVLPAAAPAGADPLVRADREYQIAAAHFYGMQYDEAARRFRAIAGDATSPWRPYGRYLAGRAMIRAATMVEPARFPEAERELLATIADPIATPLHASAQELLTFVRLRSRPDEELRAISTRLATTTGVVRRSDLVDFTYLMDGVVGDTVNFKYDLVDAADATREGNDLADWVLAFQGEGPEARDRTLTRWRDTKSEPWLVAALWHLRGATPDTDAVLQHAAAVPATSASYPTVTFLRVRLLIALGRHDDARQLLAALPDEPRPGFSTETINLLRGERLMVARDLEELLRTAPRSSVPSASAFGASPANVISFDEDAAAVLNDRLPLDRLVDAALSKILPARLRTRVAIAAFTRAIILNRHDAARRVAPALRETAPMLAGDLDVYLRASTPEASRRAAVLLILRTPGMTRSIRGLEDHYSIAFVEPRRIHESFTQTWWCGPYPAAAPTAAGDAQSELIHVLYPSHNVPPPAFLSAEERQTAERERTDLLGSGHAARYLATAALAWVRERPADPQAAEALSRIVNGWRRTCRDQGDAQLARQSFQELHRRFPSSEWAKRTKYWYQ